VIITRTYKVDLHCVSKMQNVLYVKQDLGILTTVL